MRRYFRFQPLYGDRCPLRNVDVMVYTGQRDSYLLPAFFRAIIEFLPCWNKFHVFVPHDEVPRPPIPPPLLLLRSVLGAGVGTAPPVAAASPLWVLGIRILGARPSALHFFDVWSSWSAAGDGFASR